MNDVGMWLHRIKRPEYTGVNRCVPCTVTNVVITLVGALLLGWLWIPIGIAFLMVGLGTIWLRGYLVPGTPQITERYFPDWILTKFEKGSAVNSVHTAGEMDTADPEQTFLEWGLVEPCSDVDDLCLEETLARRWTNRMGELENGGGETKILGDLLGIDPGTIDVKSTERSFTATADDRRIGQWESKAAYLADLAAIDILSDWVDGWDSIDFENRAQLVSALRIFIEECPLCSGGVTPNKETVKSCCRSHDVVAVECNECGARLLELPYDSIA